ATTLDSISVGYFQSNSSLYGNFGTVKHGVLTGRYNGSSTNFAAAVYGDGTTSASNGAIGGYFTSNGISLYAQIYSPASGSSFESVYGVATAGNGTTCYGVHGDSYGTGYNYGIYGEASFGTTNYAGYFAGNVYATGTITSSDKKLKRNIEPLNGGIDLVMKLKPATYYYRSDEKEFKRMNLPVTKQFGLIAQEVEEVIPSIVSDNIQPAQMDRTTHEKIAEEIHFKGMNYTELVPVLISAVKEQQKMIEDLKKEIEELKRK
ncbi:MAG: hypothetical protein JWO06_1290, partial [Bacteroidota bacterium]|nr:hypothetical protein [Bacteroidota bacterium]